MRLRSQPFGRKFVQRDQQIRHTLTGCVTDRVGDGRSNATQNTVKLTTNLLDHGVADTLGLVGAIMPATLNCEFDAHFGVQRSTATGSPKSSTGATRPQRRGSANLRPPGISSCIWHFTLPL
jgi:hypothetical protein